MHPAAELHRRVAARADRGAERVDLFCLEAKRLLVHSDRSVAAIGAALGFDDPTNFVKYFRRETGTTPGVFRSNHRAWTPTANGA